MYKRKEIYFKELAPVIMEAGKFNISRVDQTLCLQERV